MKLTKETLKQLIKEELNEAMAPRADIPASGHWRDAPPADLLQRTGEGVGKSLSQAIEGLKTARHFLASTHVLQGNPEVKPEVDKIIMQINEALKPLEAARRTAASWEGWSSAP